MATSKKSTGKKSKNPTLSQAATPANRSRKQANAKARKTQDTSGHGYEKPLANYDPTTQSWKMCQDISLWEEPKSLERLPKSGMTRNGVLYRQPDWVPIISERESSSWPTPTALTRPMEGNVRMLRAKTIAGEMTEAEATAMLGKSVWEAQGKIPAMWPTPSANEHKYRLKGSSQASKNLNALHGGKLNPTWVEWLMGFPTGWTDLED